jgi:integrase
MVDVVTKVSYRKSWRRYSCVRRKSRYSQVIMSVFKRGKGIYWFEFEFRGSRIRESSHSKNKEVCERLMRERRRTLELSGGGLKEIAKPKLFGPAAQAYLLLRKPHWSVKTRRMHANSLTHLTPHFGKRLLSEIDRVMISRYQLDRLNEGVTGRTVNIELALVRLVLRDAKLWQNISSDVKMLHENSDVGRELTDDECYKLLSACKSSMSRSLYPAVLVSIHTGLRSHELRLLRWRQVDLVKGSITVGKSKTEGGKGRIVYLSATAILTLESWKAKFTGVKPDHYVFPRETYLMRGKDNGQAVEVMTDPSKPFGTWNRSWKTAKKLERRRKTRMGRGGEQRSRPAADQTLMALFGWMSPKMIERYSHVREEAKMRAMKIFDEPGGSPQIPPQSGLIQ